MNNILKKINSGAIKNKTIILRADLDVPLKNERITDDTRLLAVIPTIEFILKNEAKIILIGHLGRPEGETCEQRKSEKFSLLPVVKWFNEKLEIKSSKLEAEKFGDFEGWKLSDRFSILENLRFYKEEETNDQEFAKRLASLGEVYVNDAFAVSHRNHASITGITKFLPSFAGLKLTEEIEVLSKVLENSKRPLVVIIGGAKIETKLPVVERMHQIADYILVGGEIAEQDKALLKVQHEKVVNKKPVLLVADLEEDKKDITKKSTENFSQILSKGETIVWNGPMGMISDTEKVYSRATKLIAEAIIKTKAKSIVGGGDTVGYLKRLNLLDKFSFVSTGGGAMLNFLAGEKLPGIEALKK